MQLGVARRLNNLLANSRQILSSLCVASCITTTLFCSTAKLLMHKQTKMGIRTSKLILTVEQAAYVRALIPLLKAVREYPYVNRRTTLFFDACDAFLKSIRDGAAPEEIRYGAKLVDVCFDKWQHAAFGCAIIPAKFVMLHRANMAWPSVPKH